MSSFLFSIIIVTVQLRCLPSFILFILRKIVNRKSHLCCLSKDAKRMHFTSRERKVRDTRNLFPGQAHSLQPIPGPSRIIITNETVNIGERKIANATQAPWRCKEMSGVHYDTSIDYINDSWVAIVNTSQMCQLCLAL